MKQLVLMATAIVLFGSCSTYRSFKTPGIEQDTVFGQGVTVQDTPTEIPSWKEMFTDNHLQVLIQKGLEANSDLRIARLNIDQSEAMLRASKLAYLPSFMLSPEGSVGSFKKSAASYTYTLPLTMQWEIDIFGKLKNRKEQALANYLQSEEYVKMVQTQLVSAIANSYYTLVMLDEQLKITEVSIANQKGNLETIIALKQAGMQNETAVNQATAAYYDVQASQKDLEKQIRYVENSMALLINEPSGNIPRSPFMSDRIFGYDPENGISLEALANRPDVKNSEYQLRANFYEVNVARTAFYPSLVLGGSAGWTNNAGGAIVNPGGLLFSALSSLTQPIFNRGINQANLKIAQAQQEQALITFYKSLLVAGTEVNDALTLCQNSARKQDLRKLQVESNKKALFNSEELMKHSSGTYLEVLIAQQAMLMSQLVQVSDWFEGVQGRINLYKALGGGIR